MKKIFIPMFFILLSLTVQATDKDNFFIDNGRGWFWYEDPAPTPKDEIKKEPLPPVSQAKPSINATDVLAAQGAALKEAASQAILNPSAENYQRYVQINKQIQIQSQQFATGLKQYQWLNPEYDYTIERPVTTQAIMAKNEGDIIENTKTLNELSEENGLIFFFLSTCQYCHRFAPILKKFSDEFGFDVIAVSLDQGSLPDFPNPKRNYELGAKLNVSMVPAVFMIDPKRNRVVKVGHGYSDFTALSSKVLYAGERMTEEGNETQISVGTPHIKTRVEK